MRVRSWLLSISVMLLSLTARAAEETGHGFSLKVHGFYLINFIIFVVIIYIVAAPGIRKALKARADEAEARLRQAAEVSEQGQAQLSEAQARTQGFAEERSRLLKTLEEDGQHLAQQIAEREVLEAAKIKAAAQRTLEVEKVRIDKSIKAGIARQAIDKVEADLQRDWRQLPHERLTSDFVSSLASLKVAGQERKS